MSFLGGLLSFIWFLWVGGWVDGFLNCISFKIDLLKSGKTVQKFPLLGTCSATILPCKWTLLLHIFPFLHYFLMKTGLYRFKIYDLHMHMNKVWRRIFFSGLYIPFLFAQNNLCIYILMLSCKSLIYWVNVSLVSSFIYLCLFVSALQNSDFNWHISLTMSSTESAYHSLGISCRSVTLQSPIPTWATDLQLSQHFSHNRLMTVSQSYMYSWCILIMNFMVFRGIKVDF